MTLKEMLEKEEAEHILKLIRKEKVADIKRKALIKASNKKARKGFLYCFKSNELIVIGKTIDIESRYKSYKSHNPHIAILFTVECDNIDEKERLLLNKIKSHFKPFQGKEWFEHKESLIFFIKSLFDEQTSS